MFGENMAKQVFSEINAKAATITGAILGFLCWLLVTPFLGAFGMMANIFHTYGLVALVISVVGGGLIGVVLAVLYNWALKLK